jgi:hypothetical protein
MSHADPECPHCAARLLGLSEPELCDDCAFLLQHAAYVALARRVARYALQLRTERAKSAVTLRREKRDADERRMRAESKRFWDAGTALTFARAS